MRGSISKMPERSATYLRRDNETLEVPMPEQSITPGVRGGHPRRLPTGQFTATPLAERLWSRVDKSGGPDACWPWTGFISKKGRGQIHSGSRLDGSFRMNPVTRVAYELTYGPLGDLLACHHCDNGICCNPTHMYAGTYSDNMRDRAARGPRKETCKYGHPFDRQGKRGRLCSICIARKDRLIRQRRKEAANA